LWRPASVAPFRVLSGSPRRTQPAIGPRRP
jgi:hypothetical protein